MILSLDIGTSSLKAGLFDMKGCLLEKRGSRIPFLPDISPPDAGYEIDPAEWMAAVKKLVPSLLAGRKETLSSIVISGNGPTLVAVGEKGEALRPAILWLDQRGNAEASRRLQGLDLPVNPSFYLAKAYWLSQHLQSHSQKVCTFLPCPEYVAFALTGRPAAVLPAPSFRGLMWCDEAIERLGMDPRWFPPLIPLGAVIGRTEASRIAGMGLEPGIPVRLAGPDFLMSLLGTATLEPGMSCDRSGSSEGINVCVDGLCRDPRLICLPHLVEGFTNVSGLVSTSGKALDWFAGIAGYRDQGSSERGNPDRDYRPLYDDIQDAEPGARKLIFLPHLAGERAPLWNADARGNFVGLTLSHGRKEMARAVAEGIGFSMRHILEVMRENGYPVPEMTVAGNLAENPVLNQIKADLTGRRILVPAVSDAELVGGACVALVGEGIFADIKEAASACVSIRRVYDPDQRHAKLYDDLYGVYREAYRELEKSFAAIASLKKNGAAVQGRES